MDSKKNIAFIINPISGIGKQKNILSDIDTYLDHDQYIPHILFTKGPKDGSRLAEEAAAYCDIIVAVGGDGSVNDVMKMLIDTDKIFGIIPSGSGNGLARHLLLPLDIPDAIKRLNTGSVLEIDTMSVNDIPFVSIAGIGFDADVAELFNKSKRRGFLKYGSIAFRRYFTYKPKKYILKFNGQKIKRRVLMINFANSNQFGYDMKISPKASLIDGLIDVVIVKKPSFVRTPMEAMKFINEKLDKSSYVEIFQTSAIKVIQKNPRFVNVDGEAVWMPRELSIKLNPKSLKVIC